MFDKDISVINKWYNPETQNNEYRVKHLKGFWSSEDSITVSDTVIMKNDNLVAKILLSEEGYVPPKQFKATGNGWTLQVDDYLVKGVINNSVSKIADIQEQYECMKITKVSIKDYGSKDMQHFDISGA